jgi:antitoxin MazE
MNARIIRIGNSRGIRIPKSLLEQSRLPDNVRIEARENEIVIRPAPRHGWEEAFRVMADRRDDLPLDEPPPTSFDETEWEW